LRINNRIRAAKVKLVSADGEMMGVVELSEALKKAEEEGLDLVEISPNIFPPITKIMDWGKYKYELSKKTRTQKQLELKTIRLSSKISSHDLSFKINQAIRFLEKGHKVKAQLRFKGREIAHREVGEEVLNKFKEGVREASLVEQDIKQIGRELSVVLAPKK